jgi:predicted ATP-grasp superfamily ATP-dependent carboligase
MQDSLKDKAIMETDVSLDKDSVVQQVHGSQPKQRIAAYDALILDAALRQSLVTVRSLGCRGLRVAALEVSDILQKLKCIPTFSSRWCLQSYISPELQCNARIFIDYLLELINTTGARVLIPSGDGSLAALRQYREVIEPHARLAMAQETALEAAINKDQTLEIAKRLGLGVPRGVMLKSVSEVGEAIHDIGLPAVVKPVESWLWGEQHAVRLICMLVTTPDEARRAVEDLTQDGGTVLFQQFLAGRREAVSLLYAHGKMYARFAQWAKRTQPPLGGTSVFRQSIALPDDITDQAERLVREIELEGYSEVEFRRDSVGKPYLMEINPRLSASIEVAVRAGVDFPYLLYQWANGEDIDCIEGYRVGGWMRYLEGDLLTTLQAIIERGRPGVTPPMQAVLECIASFFVPSGYDYFDWRDPLPMWSATKDFAYRLCQKSRKR